MQVLEGSKNRGGAIQHGGKGSTIRLKAVGDICLGDSPYCIGHGVGSQIKKAGGDKFAKGLSALLDDADIAFGNLECVLSKVGRNRFLLDSIEMRGDPASVKVLARAKASVINVANNHIFQHGVGAYKDTIVNLDRVGIVVVGDEERQCATSPTVEMKDVNLTFLGFSLRPEQYRRGKTVPYVLRDSKESIVREVKSRRQTAEGILVVSLHWGREYMEFPSKEQQILARELVDEGVDLILGHHPHVLQGIERYKHGLIAYSLGNIIFDLANDVSRDSMVLEVDVTSDGIADYRAIPVSIGRDYVPRVTEGDERRRTASRIARLSQSLPSSDLKTDHELSDNASKAYNEFRHWCYRYFLGHFYLYNPYYYAASLTRALLRRLGFVHNP